MIVKVLMVNDWILGVYSTNEKAVEAEEQFRKKRPRQEGSPQYYIRTYECVVDAAANF